VKKKKIKKKKVAKIKQIKPPKIPILPTVVYTQKNILDIALEHKIIPAVGTLIAL
jgi:hypothetical protein